MILSLVTISACRPSHFITHPLVATAQTCLFTGPRIYFSTSVEKWCHQPGPSLLAQPGSRFLPTILEHKVNVQAFRVCVIIFNERMTQRPTEASGQHEKATGKLQPRLPAAALPPHQPSSASRPWRLEGGVAGRGAPAQRGSAAKPRCPDRLEPVRTGRARPAGPRLTKGGGGSPPADPCAARRPSPARPSSGVALAPPAAPGARSPRCEARLTRRRPRQPRMADNASRGSRVRATSGSRRPVVREMAAARSPSAASHSRAGKRAHRPPSPTHGVLTFTEKPRAPVYALSFHGQEVVFVCEQRFQTCFYLALQLRCFSALARTPRVHAVV